MWAGRSAGLYVHVPFCGIVCPYCDFAVRTGGPDLRRRYREHVEREVALYGGDRGLDVNSVYLGGGTPSLLDPDELRRLLAAVRAGLEVRADAWLTLEANPEDVTSAQLDVWRALGVRTVSLGVQSLSAERLGYLGRRHDPETARACVRLSREAGIEVVSVDLIYGLPGDTAADVRAELAAAVELGADHLSCYQLTVKDGTLFGKRRRRGELAELGDDAQAELFLLVHRFLADAGYAPYEVSSFARRPDARSRHNRKYWDHSPYLGLGPAAHSFDGRQLRWWNQRRLSDWQDALAKGERPVAGQEELSREDLALEELMLRLRTVDGVDLDGFRERHGVSLPDRNRALVERLVKDGLIALTEDRLRPTARGLAVADRLAASFDLAG